jgi:hypothetical protein
MRCDQPAALAERQSGRGSEVIDRLGDALAIDGQERLQLG